jgi:pimeloyl-ACP methyl ester carboxylesterase
MTLRAVAALVVLVALFAISGIAYQYFSEKFDLRRHPPPGRLVDIGGRKLHLLCSGSAVGPSVIIEAGSGDDSTLWEDMVRRVSAFAHVCTYDRAGLGWSDPAPGARTFDDRAEDLHALVAAANLPGPYILAGHSYGGYIIRRFAALFPAAVSGVVLIDAPEEEFSFAPDGLQDIDRIGAQERRLGWLTRLGLMRAAVALFPGRFDPARGVPAEIHELMTALTLRTSRHFARTDEMASYRKAPATWRVAGGFGLLGNTPLIVVSRAARDPVSRIETIPEWQEGQLRLTRLSTASTHVVADRSGHIIQFSQPGVIANAIRRVLADATKTAHD